MGSWQNADFWYRLAVVAACASIVVTAVYILRALGKVMMGPLQIPSGSSPSLSSGNVAEADAHWNEKLAAALLIAGIVIIGVAPLLLQHLLNQSAADIMQNVSRVGF